MSMKKQEKVIIWTFVATLILSAASNIINIISYNQLLQSISFGIVLILDLILIYLSIKEIKRGNKALGIIVLIVSALDVLTVILGLIVAGFMASGSI